MTPSRPIASSLASSLSPSMFRMPMYRVPFVFCCLQEREERLLLGAIHGHDHKLEALSPEQELRGDPIVDDLELIVRSFGSQDVADQANGLRIIFHDEDGVGQGIARRSTRPARSKPRIIAMASPSSRPRSGPDRPGSAPHPGGYGS